MQAILGVFFHFVRGFASNSLYVPCRKVKQWLTEIFWLVDNRFSWLYVFLLATLLSKPVLAEVISNKPAPVVLLTYCCGVVATHVFWHLFFYIRHRYYSGTFNTKTPLTRNYLFSALALTALYLLFFFSGIGESKTGNGSSSWILHLSCIILITHISVPFFKGWNDIANKNTRYIYFCIVNHNYISYSYKNRQFTGLLKNKNLNHLIIN